MNTTATVKTSGYYLTTEQLEKLESLFVKLAMDDKATKLDHRLASLALTACSDLTSANETIAAKVMHLRSYADELVRDIARFGYANSGTPCNLEIDIATAKAEGKAAMMTVIRLGRTLGLIEVS